MFTFQNIDFYCERLSSDFWAEPFNAISNFSFILSSIILWIQLRRIEIKNNRIQIAIVLIFLIGIGSFLFHTVADDLTYYFDVVPIFSFQIFILHEILKSIFQSNVYARFLQISVFIFSTLVLSRKEYLTLLNGSLGYLPSVAFLLYLSIQSYRYKKIILTYFLKTTGIFVVSLLFRSIDMYFCNLNPHGFHMFWHILNALVLYNLVQILIVNEKLNLNESKSSRLSQ